MAKRKRIVTGAHVLRSCDHPHLLGVEFWPLLGGEIGTCADFDCGSTVAVLREDGTTRNVLSRKRKDSRNVSEV